MNSESEIEFKHRDVVACIRRKDGQTLQTPPVDPEQLQTGLTVCICTYKRPKSLGQFLSSLAEHEYKPDRLVIVDASPDERTKQAFAAFERVDDLAAESVYWHVTGELDTLTCSRNFALTSVATDLLVFFDDDIVLKPGCLQEMVKVHRQHAEVVGVGALDLHGLKKPSSMWRIRRLFGIVPTLKPGTYTRSGISIPWTFQGPTDEILPADWLSGCCMMWKTAIARKVKFNEGFAGHSTGEDLDLSLRMGRHGKLMVAGKAHILHLHDSAGRPNSFMMAYAGIHNAYDIHRRCLANRSWLDVSRFMYAYGMDTFLRGLTMLRPGQISRRWNFFRGRVRFFLERLLPLRSILKPTSPD
jgi:GT2 family glycosyltransferase